MSPQPGSKNFPLINYHQLYNCCLLTVHSTVANYIHHGDHDDYDNLGDHGVLGQQGDHDRGPDDHINISDYGNYDDCDDCSDDGDRTRHDGHDDHDDFDVYGVYDDYVDYGDYANCDDCDDHGDHYDHDDNDMMAIIMMMMVRVGRMLEIVDGRRAMARTTGSSPGCGGTSTPALPRDSTASSHPQTPPPSSSTPQTTLRIVFTTKNNEICDHSLFYNRYNSPIRIPSLSYIMNF